MESSHPAPGMVSLESGAHHVASAYSDFAGSSAEQDLEGMDAARRQTFSVIRRRPHPRKWVSAGHRSSSVVTWSHTTKVHKQLVAAVRSGSPFCSEVRDWTRCRYLIESLYSVM